MLLALLYSVFRLLLDALVDRRRSDASLRLELLVLRHQLRVLERRWLIQRFVDQKPEFIYVPAEEVKTVAEREGAVPFDAKDVELGHVAGAAASSRSWSSTTSTTPPSSSWP